MMTTHTAQAPGRMPQGVQFVGRNLLREHAAILRVTRPPCLVPSPTAAS